ncbi:9009_t:CDS:2 [Entrophospora sp. SA101]|nr:9009_t:CDS:2 [Entrophospora sp. SA101]
MLSDSFTRFPYCWSVAYFSKRDGIGARTLKDDQDVKNIDFVHAGHVLQ